MEVNEFVVKSHVYGKNPYDVFIVRFNLENETPSSVELREITSLSDLCEKLGDDFIPQKELQRVVESLEEKGSICFFPKDVIAFAKENVIKAITAFGSSPEIDSFTYNGIPLWLDQRKRSGLITRFDAEESMGKTETTLWADTTPIKLSIKDGRKMLYTLECYASACFDTTASHKAAVKAMTTLEEVLKYDFTKDYPIKLEL